MNRKLIAILLSTLLLLTGCSKETEPTVEEDEGQEVELINLDSTCGQMYKDFLQLGATSTEDITAKFSDWTYNSTDTFESWEYDVNDEDKRYYSRNYDTGEMNYTLTFSIYSDAIDSWIGKEVKNLDVIYNTVHNREASSETTWTYTWAIPDEGCTLKIYSTGETGHNIGLISFVRSTPTFVTEDEVTIK